MIQPLQFNSISFKSSQISPALRARIEAQKTLQSEATTQPANAKEIVAQSATEETTQIKTEKKDRKKTKTPKEKKPSLYQRAKKGIVNFMQNCNTAGAVLTGTAKGLPAAVGTLGAVSVVGKSIIDAIDKNTAEVAVDNIADAAEKAMDNKAVLNIAGVLFDSVSNIVSDVAKGISGIAKFIGDIPNKTIIENVKAFFSPIPKLYSKYLNVFNKAGEGIRTYRAVAAVATLLATAVFSVKFIKEKFAANEKNADLDHKTNLGHVK